MSTKTKRRKYKVYTDGSLVGKDKMSGGWAALVVCEDLPTKLYSGQVIKPTNNKMEMLAVIHGIYVTEENADIEIYTDSQYVQNPFTEGWIDTWQANGWKRVDGKAVKNQDLWEILIDAMKGKRVKWNWIKGHSGHIENEIVDKAAQQEARALQLQLDVEELIKSGKIKY